MKRLRGKKNEQLKGIMKTTSSSLPGEKVSIKFKNLRQKRVN